MPVYGGWKHMLQAFEPLRSASRRRSDFPTDQRRLSSSRLPLSPFGDAQVLPHTSNFETFTAGLYLLILRLPIWLAMLAMLLQKPSLTHALIAERPDHALAPLLDRLEQGGNVYYAVIP